MVLDPLLFTTSPSPLTVPIFCVKSENCGQASGCWVGNVESKVLHFQVFL